MVYILNIIIYILFFFSGISGLIYEIIWSRQFLLLFGNTTYSVVAVVSAFMGGLGLGSYLFGKIADRIHDHLRLYAFLETGIGITAFSTIYTLGGIQVLYNTLFINYPLSNIFAIGLKFILSLLILAPSTILMGATLPVLVKALRGYKFSTPLVISRLYFTNTFGACFGVILAGFLMIELLGLRRSLESAVFLNLAIGGLVLILSFFLKGKKETYKKSKTALPSRNYFILGAFALSGMVAMSYQILWVRLLTPSTGTYIYAFSNILALFLFGLAAGSYLFEHLFLKSKNPFIIFGLVSCGIALSAILSVVVNTSFYNLGGESLMAATILPGTILMGMTFPLVSYIFRQQSLGSDVGIAYFLNTIGAIAGMIITAFVVIPLLGTSKGILLFSLLSLAIGMSLIYREVHKKRKLQMPYAPAFTFAFLVLLLSILFLPEKFLLPAKLKRLVLVLEKEASYEIAYREDEVASVLGYRSNKRKDHGLLIDGIPTTSLVSETALLAHIPLLLHPHPKDVLVVALGMGRTYHSALLHPNVKVDVVELVPSVPALMYLFQDDYKKMLSGNRGKIIINDGRNYVRTTKKLYDVIISDPPPPVNAAGTTILYSKEFYRDSKRLLNRGGIFIAWFYADTRVDDFRMLLKSFYENFPYVLILSSPNELGYFLVGTEYKLKWDSQLLASKLGEKYLDDINKNTDKGKKLDIEAIDRLFLGNEDVVEKFTKKVEAVTDDHPRTEYFLLRSLLKPQPLMSKKWISDD